VSARAAVHLWYARTDALEPPLRLATRARGKPEHLIARALVRSVLSRLTGFPTTAWRFGANDYGRPVITRPAGARELRFSLSHTRGLIVCLTAWNRQVGVDAERLRDDESLLDVADRCFDPGEAAALRGLPAGDRHVRFLEHWTLKEAYLKARGIGLSISPRRVQFDLEGGVARDIRASFAPPLSDDTSRWGFGLHRITEAHVVATAVERGGSADGTLVVNDAAPALASPDTT